VGSGGPVILTIGDKEQMRWNCDDYRRFLGNAWLTMK